MAGHMVRVHPKTHAQLQQLARAKHLSLTDTLGEAVEQYRRKLLLEEWAEQWNALSDAVLAEEREELALWDCTLGDGLEEEPA